MTFITGDEDILSTFAIKIKSMENVELFFFCNVCERKSPEEILSRACTIPHTVKSYKKGEHVAYQGDRVDFLYMLAKGKIKSEVVSDPGITLQIDEISAPHPLAAIFLFSRNNHFPVDVIALEDSEIILITKDSIEKQMAKCPYFLRGFMAFTSDRALFLSERLKIFSLKGIKTKVAFYLFRRAKGDEFELGQSITSLAKFFRVDRSSLSRAISGMVHDGIIEFKEGKGKIIDRNALKNMF